MTRICQWRHSVYACFAVLRQLTSIRRSVSLSVLQSLIVSLVQSRLGYGTVTLAGMLYPVRRTNSSGSSQSWTPLSAAGVFIVLVRPHHSTPSSATWQLQNTFSTNSPFWLSNTAKKRHRRIPGRWTLPARGPRDSIPPTISVDVITACPPYTAVNRRWSSFSDCRPPTWNTRPRHLFTVAIPLGVFISLTFVVPVKCLSFLDTVIDHSCYLLFYILT